MYNPAHECDFLDSHEFAGAFKNHYGPLIPHIFHVNFWPDSYFLSTVFIALASCDDKQLPLIVFDKWPREKAVHSEQDLNLVQ